MSRLLDRIEECTRAKAQPLGFGVARKTARLCPIVVARLASTGIEDLKERLDGADAVIIPPVAMEDSKGLDVVWGAWLDGTSAEEVSAAGGDFVVFKAEETPLSLLEDEETGKVMLADVSTDDSLLKAISGTPADAVLAVGESLGGDSLNWQKLLYYQRLSDFIKQPLLAPVPLSITEKELQALWGSGVVGLVVELSGQEAAGALKRLRKLVEDTDFVSARKEKSTVVLPKMSAEPPKTQTSPPELPEIAPEEDE